MAQYLQLTLVSKLLASPAYTYSVVKALPSPMQMIGFFTNLVVPITIDKHPEWYHPPQISSSPLLNNVLLLLLFTIQHRYIPHYHSELPCTCIGALIQLFSWNSKTWAVQFLAGSKSSSFSAQHHYQNHMWATINCNLICMLSQIG